MSELDLRGLVDPKTKNVATLPLGRGGLPIGRSAVALEQLDQHRKPAGNIQRWLLVLNPTTSQ